MRWVRRLLVTAAVAVLVAGCSGPSDDERRAQWEANEPHAYAYWFWWGDMSGGYSIRVEIVGDEIVRTDLGPNSRDRYRGPSAPHIDDVFDLLDRARSDADGAEKPRLTTDFDDSFGFPTEVGFNDEYTEDGSYGFGIAGFEVIEPRRPDG